MRYGSARTAREIGEWAVGRGLPPLPPSKLRQYLWAADDIADDGANGGWHLTAAPPKPRAEPEPDAASPDPMSGVWYE